MYEATGPLKHAPISLAASGDLVALVSGRRIRVIAYHLVAAGAVTVKFQSGGTTDLTGAMTCATGAAQSPAECRAGHFQTAVGEKLNLVLSAAVQVSGHLTYQETL